MALPPSIVRINRIDCGFEPMNWAWADRERSRIDAHWRERLQRNAHLYDGRVLLLGRGAIEGDTFRGSYFATSYANFLGWRDFGFPDTSIRNCFAMAALLSADGAYILGQMGQTTASPGRIYFPAGTPEPADLVCGRVDLAGNVLRELEEETGLRGEEVEVEEGWTLAIGESGIACMRRIRTRETAERMVERMLANIARQSLPELAGFRIVRRLADMEGLDMPGLTKAFLRHELA
jgi:8-oxo-dGTP pyrophosphatase MutT (NUDIX family)